jgi:cytochrome c oxidase cbb3-type subunit 3
MTRWFPVCALVLLAAAAAAQEPEIIGLSKPSLKLGKSVFVNRCTPCHGKDGEGDGRLASVIKDPPPFNLTLSRAPDDYLRQIVSRGGAAMGRSGRMPPWSGELSEPEIEAVVLYVKTLRRDISTR